MDLAVPIAERGQSAIPFLLQKLTSKPDSIAVRDILLIFETMAGKRIYDVKSDAKVMAVLRSSISGMKGGPWKSTCIKGLKRIEDRK